MYDMSINFLDIDLLGDPVTKLMDLLYFLFVFWIVIFSIAVVWKIFHILRKFEKFMERKEREIFQEHFSNSSS